jgi:hypothetical protein
VTSLFDQPFEEPPSAEATGGKPPSAEATGGKPEPEPAGQAEASPGPEPRRILTVSQLTDRIRVLLEE